MDAEMSRAHLIACRTSARILVRCCTSVTCPHSPESPSDRDCPFYGNHFMDSRHQDSATECTGAERRRRVRPDGPFGRSPLYGRRHITSFEPIRRLSDETNFPCLSALSLSSGPDRPVPSRRTHDWYGLCTHIGSQPPMALSAVGLRFERNRIARGSIGHDLKNFPDTDP
jgi:hypothetical protein